MLENNNLTTGGRNQSLPRVSENELSAESRSENINHSQRKQKEHRDRRFNLINRYESKRFLTIIDRPTRFVINHAEVISRCNNPYMGY